MTAPNTPSNTVPAWVAAACAHADDHPHLSHPWEFDWLADRWTIGTNDHIAVLVRGKFGAPDANAPDSKAPDFTKILGVPANATRRTVDLDALRAWLGVDGVGAVLRRGGLVRRRLWNMLTRATDNPIVWVVLIVSEMCGVVDAGRPVASRLFSAMLLGYAIATFIDLMARRASRGGAA